MPTTCENCNKELETDWSFSVGEYWFYRCRWCGATILRKDVEHSYKVIYNSYSGEQRYGSRKDWNRDCNL